MTRTGAATLPNLAVRIRLAIVLLLPLLVHPLISGDATRDALPMPPSMIGKAAIDAGGEMSLRLDYTCMGGVVQDLRWNYHVRVSFEMIAYDMKKDVILLKDGLATLEAKKRERKLTEMEEKVLAGRVRLRDAGAPMNTVVDMAAPRVTATVSAPSIAAFLDQLTAGGLFPDYAWEERNGTYVIFPRGRSVLSFPVTLTAENQPLRDVVRQIVDQRPPGVNIWSDAPRSSKGFSRYAAIDAARVRRLVLRNVSARDALCRAVEAAGPTFCWGLEGYQQARWLTMDVLPHNARMPEGGQLKETETGRDEDGPR